jgi:hypothetical protein
MIFHLTSAVIFIAIFANKCVVECASQKEVCPCVPLNICPEISHHFKETEDKYFSTILKCSESGHVRCCLNSDKMKLASRRSDDDSDTIFIGDSNEDETTTENVIDITTKDDNFISETTTEYINVITTDETSNTSNNVINSSNVELVYPDHSAKNKSDEHLFLIYPNVEDLTTINNDSTLANFINQDEVEFTTTNINEVNTTEEETTIPNIEIVTTTIANNVEEKPIQKRKRVVIKKRLKKKLVVSESLEGAESKISKTLVKPNEIQPTEESIPSTSESTTRKKKVRKILRTRSTTIDPNLLTSTTTTSTPLTIKPRKILYDTKTRTNFLKKPSNQIQQDLKDYDVDDDESIDMTVTLPPITTSSTEASTTTSQPTTTTIKMTTTSQVMSKKTTPLFTSTVIIKKKSLPKVVQQANRIDLEHKTMIQTLHKALFAIHSGVDMVNVEKMIENHKVKMDEIRKNPPAIAPTRPYRGSAKYRRPTTIKDYNFYDSSRIRNISKAQRLTTTTTTTTTKPVERITIRKSPRLAVTQPPTPPTHPINNIKFREFELPSNATPNDFRPSQLYGITMDQSHQLDSAAIEKIYKIHEPPKSLQNGFYPVIENGTPSTIL